VVAAVAFGSSLLHVAFSHLAVNDASASFFLAAGLLFGARGLVAPRRREYLLAGLAAGLALAAKYNFGVILVLPLAGAAALRAAGRLDTPAAVRRVELALLGGLVGLLAGMPELLSSPGEIWQGVLEQARLGASRWNGQSVAPIPALYAETLLHGAGAATVAAALLGLVRLLRTDPWRSAALLACPVVYLALMVRNELFFARFVLPLLPFVALFGAVGVAWLASLVAAGWRRWLAIGLALAAIGVPSGLDVARHDRLATTPDTRVLAQAWARERAGDALVAAQLYSLPIGWAGERARRPRLRRFQSLADSADLRRLACDGARYVMIASFTAERELARLGPGASRTGYQELARHADLVQTFSPFRDGRVAPVHPDNTAIPFWHLDAYARPGPRIDVYQLPDDGRALCRTAGR
jgi:hypothetical protein